MRQAKIFRIVIAAACTVGLAGGAFAAQPESVQERLQDAEERVAAQAEATKGAAQQELRMQKEHIDRLIRRMEAGEPVSASEVDGALQKSGSMPY